MSQFLRLKNKNYKIPHDRFNIKEIFNFNELVNRKPLGAIIATPTIYHPDNSLFFLNKEIPTYIEKTFHHAERKIDCTVLNSSYHDIVFPSILLDNSVTA